MKQLRWKAAAVRGGRFYVVGALGMVVQLSLLALLLHGCHLGYVAATAVAVELTVLHENRGQVTRFQLIYLNEGNSAWGS